MSNPRKVDIATEADWSFYENSSVRRAAGLAARTIASKFSDTAELDDLEQDALLFLAVRPGMVKVYVAAGGTGMDALQWRIYRYLYEQAEREACRSKMEVASEPL